MVVRTPGIPPRPLIKSFIIFKNPLKKSLNPIKKSSLIKESQIYSKDALTLSADASQDLA